MCVLSASHVQDSSQLTASLSDADVDDLDDPPSHMPSSSPPAIIALSSDDDDEIDADDPIMARTKAILE